MDGHEQLGAQILEGVDRVERREVIAPERARAIARNGQERHVRTETRSNIQEAGKVAGVAGEVDGRPVTANDIADGAAAAEEAHPVLRRHGDDLEAAGAKAGARLELDDAREAEPLD